MVGSGLSVIVIGIAAPPGGAPRARPARRRPGGGLENIGSTGQAVPVAQAGRHKESTRSPISSWAGKRTSPPPAALASTIRPLLSASTTRRPEHQSAAAAPPRPATARPDPLPRPARGASAPWRCCCCCPWIRVRRGSTGSPAAMAASIEEVHGNGAGRGPRPASSRRDSLRGGHQGELSAVDRRRLQPGDRIDNSRRHLLRRRRPGHIRDCTHRRAAVETASSSSRTWTVFDPSTRSGYQTTVRRPARRRSLHALYQDQQQLIRRDRRGQSGLVSGHVNRRPRARAEDRDGTQGREVGDGGAAAPAQARPHCGARTVAPRLESVVRTRSLARGTALAWPPRPPPGRSGITSVRRLRLVDPAREDRHRLARTQIRALDRRGLVARAAPGAGLSAQRPDGEETDAAAARPLQRVRVRAPRTPEATALGGRNGNRLATGVRRPFLRLDLEGRRPRSGVGTVAGSPQRTRRCPGQLLPPPIVFSLDEPQSIPDPSLCNSFHRSACSARASTWSAPSGRSRRTRRAEPA